MNLRRALAVARRIIDGFRRDHRSMALMFVVPVAITALLGWVIADSAPGGVRLAVDVRDAGPVGERLVTALRDAAAETGDDAEREPEITVEDVSTLGGGGREAVRDGTADVAIVVPRDLAADIAAGRDPTLIVVTAGDDPGGDAVRLGAVQRLLTTVAAGFGADGRPVSPEIVRETVYLSPDANQLDVIAPVFLAFFAYFFVFILTGISFLRERIGGTLERLLATPVTRAEIVVGYGLGFGIFATLQVLVLTAFVLGRLGIPAIGPLPSFAIGLGVPVEGSPVLAFVIALVLALGAVNLGIFLSTFARTELQILQFIPLVIVPQGLLSGILWPVERLPELLGSIARLLPVTYAVEGLRLVMLRGADLGSTTVLTDLAVLVAVALVFVVLAAATIKREVA